MWIDVFILCLYKDLLPFLQLRRRAFSVVLKLSLSNSVRLSRSLSLSDSSETFTQRYYWSRSELRHSQFWLFQCVLRLGIEYSCFDLGFFLWWSVVSLGNALDFDVFGWKFWFRSAAASFQVWIYEHYLRFHLFLVVIASIRFWIPQDLYDEVL